MKFHIFPALLAIMAMVQPATAASLDFRAPGLAAQLVSLPAPKAAEATTAASETDPLQVGTVRTLAKSSPLGQWQPIDGGYVGRLRAESAGAQGLRVRLDLGAVPGAMEVRVQGSTGGRVESLFLDPTLGPDAWTPWTEGESQLIEVFSAVEPSDHAVRIGAIVHFTTSPFAKAALECTLSTECTTGEPALDVAIAERKKSSARIIYVNGDRAFVCSATLIDTPLNPAAYVLTANHCIGDAASARSIASFWFYESTACTDATPDPGWRQAAGGMQLVFGNFNVDSSLLLMNQAPPPGVSYAPLNAALVAAGTPIVSLSHPDGDTARWAVGTMAQEVYDVEVPYRLYRVNFNRGMVEGGSSGSGAYVRANGRLELVGVLSKGPINQTCSNPDKYGAYGRLEAFHPQMAQYIGAATPGPDDAPNRPADVTSSISGAPVDTLSQPLSVSRRIDYAGDVDVFQFTVASTAAVTTYTEGNLDLVSTFLAANGVGLEANDDSDTTTTNTGITRVLGPGTYYVHVAHWVPSGTGPYSLVIRADRVDTNYTSLWWNASESGWGINVNHQGNIIFATLFTYADDGAPMWLVMSRGERQADGSYSGLLHRTTGPAFNANPWTAVSSTEVGTLRLAFSGADNATLTYSINGRSVTKAITRQLFKQAPECSWSYFDRSIEGNMQDLWWNPGQSGWGINLAHQEDTVFATLFTYAPNGQGLWLVMPEGVYQGGFTFSGPLYRTRGPAFDASPWSPIQSTRVGSMSLTFEHGNSAALEYTVDGVAVSKSIIRQVFSSPKTKCVT